MGSNYIDFCIKVSEVSQKLM